LQNLMSISKNALLTELGNCLEITIYCICTLYVGFLKIILCCWWVVRMTVFCIYRPVEVVTLKQPHVVQELTSVLREWGHIWKRLYIVSTKTVDSLVYTVLFHIYAIVVLVVDWITYWLTN
jgi:hypothetical protein